MLTCLKSDSDELVSGQVVNTHQFDFELCNL